MSAVVRRRRFGQDNRIGRIYRISEFDCSELGSVEFRDRVVFLLSALILSILHILLSCQEKSWSPFG